MKAFVQPQLGVFPLTAEEYHADPVPGGSLSSSGARRLLPPSCPALFDHERRAGRLPKRTWDFGHAAHQRVLGAGPDIVAVPADNWRTKAAQEAAKDARAAGKVPVLESEAAVIEEMAAALRAHPIASVLFRPGGGTPEQALIWQDRQTGVWLRALVDWLPDPGPGRLIVADYKTTRSAAPADLAKVVYDYGYHQQAAWYLDGVRALGLAGELPPAFVFVAQEKTPPYLVTVFEPDLMALRIGAYLNRQAIDLYAQCVATGRWPGYSDDVELISLPPWVESRYAEELS
ncbi:PD-(D/E)XK nuclease-like domain-containing protein [Catenuloplanes atrovinosus]|uniref:Putative exodeoxyribonuclease 8 PDDEXK-like domain-containing protein n=1 Tax=Catenuloplanes atrovinosus TaxID=137266 RepID=A0AAE4CC72_9ACTN|nr:PD-(D/E)XK nuclease-like domain-containing protein [Catenuloplanes atrovinosus]MDR7278907.1 hypothetical protein [Catenuloplanes atrovinosus]